MEHPRHQARHEEEWREAVERIHERLLQESGRRFFGNETLLKTFEKHMGVSKNSGTPKSSHFNRVFPYTPSILGVFPLFFGNTHMVVNIAQKN